MQRTPDEFRKFIEVEVLKIIKKLASEEQGQEKVTLIAQTTVELIKPGMSLEELYLNAVKLDDLLPELAPVVYAVMKEYETRHERKAIDEVSNLIKSQKYDEAQEMVKKVLAFKAHQ